jgi:DsbC/DsbD-like thiol-disulfide interchange protein
MRRTLLVVVVMTVFATSYADVWAQLPKDLVKAELLADVSAIKPGEPFTVGVLLRIENGWHIYWENPGDSGMATSVKITAPQGFDVGPVEFPVPLKFDQPGSIVGYGYLDRVLLTAKVTPPPKLDPGANVPISAAVSWLCCEKVCIPGSTKLSLSLPIVTEAKPANKELFDEWLPRIPMDAATAGVTVNSLGSADAAGNVDSRIVVVKWPDEVKDVQWFPAASDVLSISGVEVTPIEDAKGARITFSTKVLEGQKLAQDKLPSVVAYTDKQGVRRGVKIDVPLKGKAVRFSP